jgi:hypothetical protein
MPNPNHLPWTDEEDDALRRAYSSWPVDWALLHERSADRSRTALHMRAKKLGITRGRLAAPDYSSVTATQWGYLAGMIDADGTIAFNQGGCKASVTVINSHRPLIDWLLATWPGGTTWTISAEKSNSLPSRQGWPKAKKDIHYAAWQRAGVIVPLLRGVIPHMIVKRERAEQALALHTDAA